MIGRFGTTSRLRSQSRARPSTSAKPVSTPKKPAQAAPLKLPDAYRAFATEAIRTGAAQRASSPKGWQGAPSYEYSKLETAPGSFAMSTVVKMGPTLYMRNWQSDAAGGKTFTWYKLGTAPAAAK